MSFDLEDQRRLEKVLSIRESIIDNILSKGVQQIDKDDRTFLIQTMEGLERTVLTKTKLKIEEQTSQHQAQTQEMVASMLLHLSSRTHAGGSKRPVLPEHHELKDIVDGETFVGVSNGSYDEFMKKIED